jgi:hypothetical protein
MKTHFKPQHHLFALLSLGLLVPHLASGAEVAPVVMAVSGAVSSGGTESLSKGDTIELGKAISSGDQSGVIIRPVPGQGFVLDVNSSAKITMADVTAGDGGSSRSSGIELLNGHTNITVANATSGSNQTALKMPSAVLTSSGGNFSGFSDSNGNQHAVVYAGSVAINVNKGGSAATVSNPVILKPGQVAKWNREGTENLLEVLDLRAGTVSEYLDGNLIGSRLATPAELQAARDFFLGGLSAFRVMATTEQKLEFAQIVADINKVLQGAGFGAIPPSSEWFLFPNLGDEPLNFPADFASPVEP